MTNNYYIKFKYGHTYHTEFNAMIIHAINQSPNNENIVSSFTSELDKFNRQALRQLNKLIQNENLEVMGAKKIPHNLKELLADMLSSLCLRKSDSLNTKLESLGIKKQTEILFIEKKKLNKALNTMTNNLGLNRIDKSFITFITYVIASSKAQLKTEEALGLFSYYGKGKGKVKNIKTRTKIESERIIDTLSKGEKLNAEGSAKALTDLRNSKKMQEVFMIGDSILGRNHEQSYNIKLLASQVFEICRTQSTAKISRRGLCVELYEVFKILYADKGLCQSEDEWKEAKNVIGNNYRDYKIKKVTSIVGSISEKDDEKRAAQFELKNGNLSIDEILELFA